ncbi:MAG TPA: DUF58 domain-containing protein [Xanthomonadaceae bacterium]|nr:DUF58 domain-containing protein [Xanthomonadaceae bacterium]
MSTLGVRADLRELIGIRPRVAELQRTRYRRRSRERDAGVARSAFRGRGMEYAESRPYAPGDDVRQMDWRVTARTGRPHTKLFQPERDRVTALVVDRSAAMQFGTRVCFKSVQAARIGALLGWFALTGGDRLAAAAGGEVIPPAAGRQGLMRVLAALARWTAPESGAAPLSVALTAAGRVLKTGSHVLILADARSLDPACEPALAALARHNDVLVALVHDALEAEAPPPARYALTDGSTRIQVDTAAASARSAWRACFQDMRDAADERLASVGLAGVPVSVADDPVQALRALLRTPGRIRRAA